IVEINETVDITVLLKGDGWALQPKPIDVILTTDRSGSMLFDNPDRMHSIREAEKIFVDQLSASRDRIGLVTFGRNGYISRPGVNSGIATSEINNVYNPYSRTYSAYATYDRSLTNNFLDVKTQIGRILPDHGTPMREGLRLSIRNLIQSARPDAIRAVIVLSDGDYNWYGDPLARGNGYTGYDADDYGDLTQNYFYYTSLNSSNQNMSQYAKNNNIKIYSIAYADTISAGGRQTLETLALSSGGKYYNASASNIEEVYAAIAGDLKTDAGVNTMVDLDYNAVEVNYTIEYNNESNPIFDYVYVDGVSTRLDSYFTDSTVMTIPDLPWIFDNTSQWSTNKKLDFSLGTVRLHQVWDIRYRLKAQKPGLYNMFGPNSTIVFNNGTQTLYLPDLFVTVIPNMIDTTVWSADLNYTYIGENSSSDNQDYYITFDINSNYTGSPDSTITETYYFVTYDGQRYEMDSRQLTYTEANQLRQYSVYVGRLPVGWQYFEPVMEGFEPNSPVISPTHPIIPPAPPKDSYFTLT
ncbi:MAG: vWA domain-containing protein, partial [Smithella sp.]